MNTVLLIGTFVDFERSDDNYSRLIIKIKRDFKDQSGEYKSDFIPLLLPHYFADIMEDFMRFNNIDKNTLLSIKGRVVYDGKVDIIADKIQFMGTSLWL